MSMTPTGRPSASDLTRLLHSDAGRTFLESLPTLTTPSAPSARGVDAHTSGRQEAIICPLAPAQLGLWYLDQLAPSSLAYVIPVAFRVAGPLDVDALEFSLRALVRRHDALRSVIRSGESENPSAADGHDGPHLVVWPATSLTLERRGAPTPLDATRGYGDTDQEAFWTEVADVLWQPFDLANGPLLRATLVRVAPEDHMLLVAIHHIVADGWSLGILYQELGSLYASACHLMRSTRQRDTQSSADTSESALVETLASSLPAASMTYAVYARAERQSLDRYRDAELAYWRERLRGAPDILELPTDFARSPEASQSGARLHFAFDAGTYSALRAFGLAEGMTLFMTILAGFQALLSRYTGMEDFLIGVPFANRTRPDTRDVVGCFVNTVPLRADVSASPSFRQLLTRVRSACLDAYEHQAFPLAEIVSAVAPTRMPGISPLVQVLFALQNLPLDAPHLDGLTVTALDVDGTAAKVDLSVEIYESANGLSGVVEYSSALFHADTISRLAEHFQILLAAAIADPDRPITELPLLSIAERHRILDEWNATAVAYPRTQSLAALFAEQVQRTPDAVALTCGQEQLTYRELDTRSTALAHYLQDTLQVAHEELVAVYLSRSSELVVSLLGILKAGGAYLPLDAAAPPTRLAQMLDDAGCRIVLTHSALRQAFPEAALATRETHTVDELFPELAKRLAGGARDGKYVLTQPVVCPATGESLCYVMYTSGSTGQPKGVAIEQHSVTRLVRNTNYARFDASETLLLFSPVSFDASTMEIWGALLNGCRLVICPPFPPGLLPLDELAALVESERVTTAFFSTVLFHHLVDYYLPQLRSLRQLLAGGEVLSVAHVTRASRELPHCRVMAAYGPTESTTYATFYPIAPGEDIGGSVPIGRPISNTQIYVLDKHMEPVPVGVPGDLYLGGEGLARGYLRRPELTSERFVPNPCFTGTTSPESVHGSRIYRTGDRARWRADGVLLFLGRSDNQVKLRGFRIELGEIGTALGQHPAIAEAYVLARADTPGDKRLVAYLVPHPDLPAETLAELEAPALRAFLKPTLPAYMIPAAFVRLTAMPVTLNGKVDMARLPSPATIHTSNAEPSSASEAGAPITTTQARLREIWASVLDCPATDIGLDTDFFSLGGNSMQTAAVLLQVHRAFGLAAGTLPLARFFATPTVLHMAYLVDQARRARGEEVEALSPMSAPEFRAPQRSEHMSDDDAGMVGDSGNPIAPVLRQDARLPEDVRQALRASTGTSYPVAPGEAAGILLTGATGFLGAFLLDALRRVAPRTRLYCLVRAVSIAEGYARLVAAQRRYMLIDETADDPHLNMVIQPVLADLSQPHLGLDANQWQDLAQQVQLIYHCAARVNFVLPYAQARTENVAATLDLIRLACSGGALRPVHFVSTLSVFPPHGVDDGAETQTWYEDDDLAGYERLLRGGYPQSKWVGERLVARAGMLGLPVTTYRPGLITGHSRTGAWNTDDAMARRLKTYLQLGIVPREGEPLAMTPVDYVAAALVVLSSQPSSLGKTFHLANSANITLAELAAWLAARGYQIATVSPADFRDAVLRAAEASPDQPLYPLLTALDEADLTKPSADVASPSPAFADIRATSQRFDTRNTQAGLAWTAISCPPVDDTLLTTYFGSLTTSGFLPKQLFRQTGLVLAARCRKGNRPYEHSRSAPQGDVPSYRHGVGSSNLGIGRRLLYSVSISRLRPFPISTASAHPSTQSTSNAAIGAGSRQSST